MSPSVSTWSIDKVVSGQRELIIKPKFPPESPKMGIMFCHGAGGLADQALRPEFAKVLQPLSDLGHPIMSHDLVSSATWGNDAGQSAMTTAKAYMHASMGAKAGKILLVGASMGGLSSFVWAKNNPTLVAGIIGIVPVSDVNDIYTNNRQGLATWIASAYAGGWSQATLGAARNPITFATAGALAGIPALLFSAASDATVIPSTVLALKNAIGASATHVSMTGDHDNYTVPVATVQAFVAANAT